MFQQKTEYKCIFLIKAALVSWYIWGTGYKKKVIVTPIGYIITTVAASCLHH